ncbi:hypothetical protein NIES4075_73750 [Tolypothrix sp. NIES-4075]|uniref:helix-turn-helix domain-containing protein n=1 Tax=Tolypothrix sp. NIES-4075 TaxID=2005459 RepID=UPI000B5CBBC2|nr:transcriptional regulator [Tolypothrix sp. NIES-4075]GAX46354.1 hypothetical protein NIES4075_73750 [Tolypothrix sp. NIES-4075]
MSVGENNKAVTDPQGKYYQMEIAGLDVPQAALADKRIRKPRNLPPTKPPLFTHKHYEMIAIGAPIISATSAYLKYPDWHEYGNGRFHFQKPFGKGRYIEFYILNQQLHHPEYICNQAEHEILNRYGLEAARLHAVFATYAAMQAEPWKEPFVLKGSELIETLQIYKTKKLTKSQKLKAIVDLALVVGTLGAVIHWYEGKLNLCVKERSLLWIVSVQEYSQPILGDVDELCEVIIRVQPGLWTYNFLNLQGEREKRSLYQYGLIPKQLFDIDPYRQKLAASLALYIVENSRAHKSGVYTIENLLNKVLPSGEIQRAIADRRYGWKLKETVDNALLVLRDIGGFGIEFDNETYPQWLRPIWNLPDNLAILPTKERNQCLLGSKCLPHHYLVKHWFPALITFKLPPTTQKDLHKLVTHNTETGKKITKCKSRKSDKLPDANQADSDSKPPQTKTNQPTELTGAIVQQGRKAIRMSQTELAHAMGKSQSWVRDIENKLKDQVIKPKYALKLKFILGMS